MKLLTFAWSVTIQAPDDFDSLNPSDMALALNDAWLNVHKSDGELTAEDEEPA